MIIKRLESYLKIHNTLRLDIGEVVVKEIIGRGGNGLVYKAIVHETDIAIKFLVTESKGTSKEIKEKRFLSEYFNVISLNETKGIVRYIDYEKLEIKDGEGTLIIPIIMMKLYEGSISKMPALKTKEQFLKIFNFLTSTIEYIHKNGIIHRDIKPENILYQSGEFILADFGIASYNPEIFQLRAETREKERVANRHFSAPEQELSGISSHQTMDIYSLGQILQWSVTGSTHRGTGRERIGNYNPDFKQFDPIIEKCLSQNPKNRFQSVAELVAVYKLSARRVNVFDDMHLLSDILRRNFPRNDSGIIFTSDKDKIDRLFLTILKEEDNFDELLWWTSTAGDSDFRLHKKGKAQWKFGIHEYTIDSIWIHYDNRAYNDFVLVHYQRGEPFIFEEKETFYAVIVDENYHISSSEENNGYAEINGEIVNLNDHDIEILDRQEQAGYFFISTRTQCVHHYMSEKAIEDLFNDHSKLGDIISPERLSEFAKEISRNRSDEVKYAS